VLDKEGTHYRKMRSALWLFLYLLLSANRKSGLLYKKIKTISSDTGWSRNLILRWLKILRRSGYIATRNTGRCLLIQIRKWKALPGVTNQTPQKSDISNLRGYKNPTPQRRGDSRNPAHLSRKSRDTLEPNEIILKRDKYKDNIEDLNSLGSEFHSFKKLGEILKGYLRTRSRYPIFNLLIKKYGQKTSNNSGN
jgi:hypothetical protein